MLKPIAKVICLTLLSCSAASYASVSPQNGAESLKSLQSMYFQPGASLLADDDIANKRFNAMREAGMAVGAQHAYVQTMNEFKRQLLAESQAYDELFAFKDIMRIAAEGEQSLYYLPPVIQESKDVTASSEDFDQIVVSGQYYQILKRERLVTAPPDWREYLLIELPVELSKPSPALLPRTPEEQKVWSEMIEKGWAAGILQASEEMSARVRNMGADFIGMVKYLRLVEEKKIRPSFVAAQYRGKQNEGNSMHLNQRSFAITDNAHFNGREQEWLPMNLDTRGTLRTQKEADEVNRASR